MTRLYSPARWIDDDNACTTDGQPDSGECYVAVDCDDGNVCNGVETCDPATGCSQCTAVCDDDNACTDDTCDPATGCVMAIDCDDGNVHGR